MKKNEAASLGFSLVEVVLALAVVSFCLMVSLALLSVGLISSNDTVRRTVASNIVSSVTADLRNVPTSGGNGGDSPQFNIAVPAAGGASGTVQSLYFSGDGNLTGAIGSAPVRSGASPAAYRVSVMFYPPSANQIGPTQVRILASWPALADPTPTTWPSSYQGAVEFVTALDRN